MELPEESRTRAVTHTLDASWVVVQPDGPPVSRHVLVRDSAEVARLVAELSAPDAADAYVTHSGRPAAPLPDLNAGDTAPIPDHVVYLAVWQEWGYFGYLGPVASQEVAPGDLVFPIGDPRSPSYVAYTSLTEFPAGTALPLDTFTDVIARFLDTAALPANVRWVDEPNARAGTFTPLPLS